MDTEKETYSLKLNTRLTEQNLFLDYLVVCIWFISSWSRYSEDVKILQSSNILTLAFFNCKSVKENKENILDENEET
jgi:hypothetical protein